MAFEKGHKKLGGKTKGIPNKATQNAREAIAAFVDGNADRLTEWLDRIALDSPKDAFNCFQSVIEYHIPKLARTEHTGGTKDTIEHTVKEADAKMFKEYMKQKGVEL